MRFINPLSMMQQALVSLPGGPPAPAAPTYYGPAHQALVNTFQQSLTQQANRPTMMQQMVKYPYVLAKEYGGFDLNPVSYAPRNDWRIDWFVAEREKAAADAAAAAAAAAQAQQGGLLMRPVQPYWGNSYDFGSADGATGNGPGGEGTGTGVGGTSGVGGAAGDGDGGGGGG